MKIETSLDVKYLPVVRDQINTWMLSVLNEVEKYTQGSNSLPSRFISTNAGTHIHSCIFFLSADRNVVKNKMFMSSWQTVFLG